jgi:hypothetical protein
MGGVRIRQGTYGIAGAMDRRAMRSTWGMRRARLTGRVDACTVPAPATRRSDGGARPCAVGRPPWPVCVPVPRHASRGTRGPAPMTQPSVQDLAFGAREPTWKRTSSTWWRTTTTRVPNYRDLTPADEQALLESYMNRVTDTCIPEMEPGRRWCASRCTEGRARGGAAARRLSRTRIKHTAAAGGTTCGCRDACPAA